RTSDIQGYGPPLVRSCRHPAAPSRLHPRSIPERTTWRIALGAGFIAEPGHPGRGWTYTAKFRTAPS
ncbi:MAG: hypothetical protein KC470_11490, partial [Dehalococcoidia bacterium]|nr:hypothetical protein [Dehalococcoidia bacterium]